ncbi:sensor histidine kinase [Nocardioides sp.]|uniref:sensor histidine kinase n=1 Tax=Nocardioides sp. TaxID=35761 RepID=UPI002ED63AF9
MTARGVRAFVSAHGDQLLAAGTAALFVAEVLSSNELTGYRGWALLVAVLMPASLALRRSMPVLPLLAAVVVIQLSHSVLPGLADTGAFLFAILVAIYSAGAHAQRATLVLTAALVVAIIPLAALDPQQEPDLGDWIFFMVFLGAPFVAGLAFRRRRLRDLELAERALAAEQESVALAEAAVEAERLRIARELHDVVAHAISLIVVQSRGGRRSLEPRDDSARRAFDTIEHAGEQALVEMRRMLQVLRTEEAVGAETLAPRPTLGRLDDLVADVARAGLLVDVVVEGTPVELPPGVDLSAYRIVQEGLTNVMKHAGRARAQVLLRYRPEDLEIEVSDDGDGGGTRGGSGHGLAGVRERVSVHGGTLHAGPRPGGGFEIRASLPTGVVA